ncbi:hypothetical protein D3C76_550330 [compost metagenome]
MTDIKHARDRIIKAMRSYVDLGLPIIPLCAHDHEGYSEKHKTTCRAAGKIPLIKGWREQETTTTAQLGAWIKEFRNLNVGLPLGKASGFVGIDIDGAMGEDMLLEISDGDVPDTWEYVTGAGRRLLYTIPVGMETKKFVNPGEGVHEECSILAEGQQTVLPPSIHATGKVYEWAEGCSPDDMDCEPAPDWLLDLIRLEARPKRPGTIDFTAPGGPVLEESLKGEFEVNPIIVSDTLLPSEFSEYVDIEFDSRVPDTGYVGKAAKTQEDDNAVTPEDLTQRITSGNRDNEMTRIIGSFCARLRSLGKDYIMVMAKNHNQQFCDPPLDDFAIESKVNYFWEREQMKSSHFRNGSIEGEAKKVFAPNQIANTAINLLENDGYCLKVDAEQSVIWMTKKTHGPWIPMDTKSGMFQGFIRDALSNPEYGGDGQWTTVRHYRDVAHSFAIELRMSGRIWKVDTHNTDTQTIDAYKHIPLAGGKLLDWKTGEVHPWDPETNLTYVLPVEYDPTATSPVWDARLKEWLPDAGSRNILQEFVGYSLIPYMGFEKALSIQGEGANGKSLFLETIQGLLGYQVVDSISMGTLFGRFGSASLLGKILNIVNEAGSDYLRGNHADTFKNLVSGGRIKADVKNQSALTFNNTAKFIFASNHDIKTGDKSEGWLRRLLIVPFEQDFRDSKVPKFEIMQELRSEYPGIFNWALEGLRRLIANQAFSESESANRKKQAYIQENDITADFFSNCLETFDLASASPDGKIVRSGTPSGVVNMLFSLWVEYRESSVQKKVDHLTKYLEKKRSLSKARTTHTLYVKKAMTECWIGLRLNIRDTGFLELLIQEPLLKYGELKEYATKQLNDIDQASGYVESGKVVDVSPNIPNSTAN